MVPSKTFSHHFGESMMLN